VGQGFVLHSFFTLSQSNAHQLTQENKKVAGFANCSESLQLRNSGNKKPGVPILTPKLPENGITFYHVTVKSSSSDTRK
jgi:hypothetical protein